MQEKIKDRAGRLVELLAKRGLTLSLAESCTGGGIAGGITDIPGASAVLAGGVVAYTPEAKVALLGLSPADLPPGCVGAKLTAAMARQIQALLRTDLALAVTGALGPQSPSPQVQVGEVYFALVGLAQSQGLKFNFAGDRETIKEAAILAGLDCLLRFIKEVVSCPVFPG